MKVLKLALIVEAIDKATAPFRKIGAALDGIGKRGSKLAGVGKALEKITAIGATAIIGAADAASAALIGLVDHVAELGEGFHLAATKAGLMGKGGVEQIQRLQYAVKQLGGDGDDLSVVFFRFQTHLANALKGNKESLGALKQLGINRSELRRLSADPQEAFLRLVDGFTALKNPTQRAALELAMFSRSGVAMAPVLTAGRKAVKGFMDQLDKVHGVMGEKDVEAAKEFIQAKREMGAAVYGLELQIGTKLMPTLTQCIQRITAWIASLKPADVQRFTDAVSGLVKKLPALLPVIEKVLEAGIRLLGKIADLTTNTSVLKGAFIALTTVLAINALVAILNTASAIAGVGIAAVRAVPMILTLIPMIGGLTDAMAALDIAMDANPIGVIALVILALITAVVVAIGGFVLACVTAYKLITNNWAGITSFFSNLWNQLASIFSTGWKKLTDMTPGWAKVLLGIAGGGALMAFNPVLGSQLAIGAGLAAAPKPGPPLAGPGPGAGTGASGGRGSGARADVHVHVTSDGKVHVAKISSDPGVDLTVHRGLLTA